MPTNSFTDRAYEPRRETLDNSLTASTLKGNMLTPSELSQLRTAAIAVSKNSYSPYSHFPVGAAILARSGRIYVGTNVENAAYGSTICAERSAMLQAVAAGEREPLALVLYTPTPLPSTPCGACRQVLAEFNPSLPIIGIGNGEATVEHSLAELLPYTFKFGGE